MRRSVRWVTFGALAVLATAGVDCDSTSSSQDCVRCTCQCSGPGGAVVTSTFESRDATGGLLEVDCAVDEDCETECARVDAPTPVSATCAEYE